MQRATIEFGAPAGDLAAERLATVAEQIRLAALAISGMTRAVVDEDSAIDHHLDRLEHRADELMRAVARMGAVIGVSEAWGLDVLFQTPRTTPIALDLPARDRSPTLAPLGVLPPRQTSAPPPVAPYIDEAAETWANGSVELEPLTLLAPVVQFDAPRPRSGPGRRACKGS